MAYTYHWLRNIGTSLTLIVGYGHCIETDNLVQFILLLAWSTIATYMDFQRIVTQPIINTVGDAISAAFLLWIMPIMIFTGILWLSLPTFAMCLCFSIAMYDTYPILLSKLVANQPTKIHSWSTGFA